MPIYEYRCASCTERFEMLMSRFDEPPPCCPRCGDARVEKMHSAFAVAKPREAAPPGPCGSSECACRRP